MSTSVATLRQALAVAFVVVVALAVSMVAPPGAAAAVQKPIFSQVTGRSPATTGTAAASVPASPVTPATAYCSPEPELDNSRATRCINGSLLRSRGFNYCLYATFPPKPAVPLTYGVPPKLGVYLPNECQGRNSDKDYIESIAQARLVQTMNLLLAAGNPGLGVSTTATRSALENQAAGVVSSRIQWEVSLTPLRLATMTGLTGDSLRNAILDNLAEETTQEQKDSVTVGFRPDIVVAGRFSQAPGTNPMDVIELKKDTNGTVAEAKFQVDTYVAAMKAAGWGGAKAANVSWYTDEFRVVEKCEKKADAKISRPVFETWASKAAAGMPGVVLVSKKSREECKDDEERKRYGTNEVVESIPGVVEVPLTVPYQTNPYPPEPPEQSNAEEEYAVDWEAVAKVAAGTAAAATAAVVAKYVYDKVRGKLLVRAAEQITKSAANAAARAVIMKGVEKAAFEGTRDALCLGPVNAATHGYGSGSVSPAALACTRATGMLELLAILSEIDQVFTADQLRAMGLTEEEIQVWMGGAASPAMVRADPRLVTLDGLNYDFHGVGEYRLLQHDVSGLEIQMRTVAATADMSSVGSLAVQTGDRLVEFDALGSVAVDGRAVALPEGGLLYVGDGALITRMGGELQLLTAFDDDGDQALIGWTPRPGARGDFRLSLPSTWAGQVNGMLGDYDGNPHNDLVSASGVDVTDGLKFGVSDSLFLQRLYGTFGDSWRVTDSNSLFTYPVGKSAVDYVDRSYPRGVTSLSDLSEAAFSQAAAICTAAGIQPGLGFDDCLLDVGLSGDPSFATSLASTDTFGVGLGDASIGADPLSVKFTGEIPPNFFPAKIRTLAVGRNYAGPFTGANDYPFYLTELPGHKAFNVTARFVTPGLSFSASNVEIVVDGTAVQGTLVPGSSTTVTLPDSSMVSVGDVSFVVPHSKRDLNALFRLKGGATVAWFGVEKVDMDLTRVPFERFDIQLHDDSEFHPATGLPVNSGAGVLEAVGSSDRYCFDLPANSSLAIDGTQFRYSLAWSLISTTSAFATRTGKATYGIQSGLSGNACLDVYVDGSATPSAWRYDLGLAIVPAPQTFALDLPVSGAPVVVSNGVPADGAGNLETKASVDEYSFTVPAGGSRVIADLSGASTW
ncbi:VWD domain-containing protein, partial [Cellulomonas sp. URHE0023]|uniref:VWD domain-containing protein n=1 Tax=Cellulomonas sp. URHE0023 TaxID=1380354 RepID=UPI0018CC3CF1